MVTEINQQDESGETELFKAVSNGDIDAVENLLASGADPCIRNNNRSSAQTLATLKGHRKIADLLKKAEQDSNCSQRWSINGDLNGESRAVKPDVSVSPGGSSSLQHTYPAGINSFNPINRSTPELPKVFFLLAVISIVASFVLATVFWPGGDYIGKSSQPSAYFMSSLWIVSGVIEAALFSAIGQGLSYLHKIYENTSR